MLRTFIIYRRTTPLREQPGEPPKYEAAGMVQASHENGYWGQMYGRPVFIKGAVEKASELLGVPKGSLMLVADATRRGYVRNGAGYPSTADI